MQKLKLIDNSENMKAVSAKGTDNAASTPISAADELMKYKNLLDSGAITQEEYESKKKQLLGL